MILFFWCVAGFSFSLQALRPRVLAFAWAFDLWNNGLTFIHKRQGFCVNRRCEYRDYFQFTQEDRQAFWHDLVFWH